MRMRSSTWLWSLEFRLGCGERCWRGWNDFSRDVVDFEGGADGGARSMQAFDETPHPIRKA
jgi:hypothetical protein